MTRSIATEPREAQLYEDRREVFSIIAAVEREAFSRGAFCPAASLVLDQLTALLDELDHDIAAAEAGLREALG